VDLNKLTQGEKVIGGSAIALLIFSFLPWYGIDFNAFGVKASASRSGWDYFLFGIIPVLLAIAMVVVIVLSRFTETKLPDPPLPWGQIHLIAGGLAGALVLLKLLIGDTAAGLDLDRKYGIFLSLIAGIGLAAGGYLKSREPAEAAPPPAL
jgi:hypothetical protein